MDFQHLVSTKKKLEINWNVKQICDVCCLKQNFNYTSKLLLSYHYHHLPFIC